MLSQSGGGATTGKKMLAILYSRTGQRSDPLSNSLQPHGLYVAHQASPSMEFSRQEYWSGLPFPSPEELPNPGIEPWSPASQANSLPFELQGSLGFFNCQAIGEAQNEFL